MKLTYLPTFLALLLATSVSNSAQAQRSNRQALKAFELGSFAEAAEAYEKIVRKSGSSPEDAVRYGESLRMLGRLDEAAAVFAEIGDLDNPDVSYRHARVLMELARYPQAATRLEGALKMKHPAAAQLANRIAYAQTHRSEPAAWKVSNEFINSSADDFGAETVGGSVVFASGRADDQLHLYRSVRDGNNFLRVPSRLHRVGAESTAGTPLSYAASGDLVAYTRHNFTAGERPIPEAGWELSLMITAPLEDGDFLPGKAFAHNGTGYSTGFPSFSPDGGRLYFASDRPGGEGGYDLYYSERQNDGWGAPVNLGPTVNSPGHEIAPHATAGALYFASDYLPGYGGMDIYRADRLGDKLTNVVNLGEGVNSSMDEVGFVLTQDGAIGYFASNRSGGKGGLDLYRATRAGTAVTFAVVDGSTRQPIPNAVLDFSNCGQGVFLTGLDGAYTFRALSTLNCEPVVRKSGFTAKPFSFVAKGVKDQQRIEIALDPEDMMTVYEGKVVDSRTGNPVPDVRVSADHLSNGFTAEAKTDAGGRYQLQLQRAGNYRIDYQATGYTRIDREIGTHEADGANALSTFAMFPSAPAGVVAAQTPAINQEDVPSEAKFSPRPQDKTEVETQQANPAGDQRMLPGSVASGYAVQVAAVKAKGADLEMYRSKLSDLGQVYGRVDGDVMRVRVGPFTNRDAAAPTLAKVRAAGFGDAFLTTEVGGKVAGIDRPGTDTPTPATPSVRATPTQEVARPGVATTKSSISWEAPAAPALDENSSVRTPGAYLIRLATFSSLANFDQAKASALGNLTTRRSGEYVVVLLQGFDDEAAAKAQVDGVRRGGFPDAHVVEELTDGTLRIVR